VTKSDLLNTFVQQVTMTWLETEMEKEATSDDVFDMITILTILLRAFQDKENPPT